MSEQHTREQLVAIAPVWARPAAADAPPLPVPPLEATVYRWVASIAPLTTEAEFRSAALAALRFINSKGAATLQAALVARAAECAAERKSYLIDWWNRLSYTTWRLPLPLNVSYWFSFDDSTFRGADEVARHSTFSLQCFRAAALTLAAAAARDALYCGTFPVERVSARGVALDPSMLRYIFHACRFPRLSDDGIRVCDGTSGPHSAPLDVVVVARGGQLFAVPYENAPAEGGGRASLQQLATRFAAVVREADAVSHVQSPSASISLNVLTAGHRDAWAEAFSLLFGTCAEKRASHGVGIDAAAAAAADTAAATMAAAEGAALSHSLLRCQAANSRTLAVIEASLAVVALDDDCVGNGGSVAACRALSDGSPANRWYDKAVQLVVSADGAAGFIGEHSHSDGLPAAAVVTWMLRSISGGAAVPGWRGEQMASRGTDLKGTASASASVSAAAAVSVFVKASHDPGSQLVAVVREAQKSSFTRLPILLPPGPAGEVVARLAATVAAAAASASASHDLRRVRSAYGPAVAKVAGVSPDAWAQMAMQLAYRTWTGGGVAPAYEPAHTRAFRWGRTACVRVTSAEATEWSSAVVASSVAGRRDNVKLLTLLRAASAAHVACARRAAAGHDVDRHLLGLRMLHREIFTISQANNTTTQRQPSVVLRDASVTAYVDDDDSAVQDFLTHPAHAKSSTWLLSTSNLTVHGVAGWGFGEVVPGGLGLAYATHTDAFSYTIIGEGDRAQRFAAHLEWALEDMASVASTAAGSTSQGTIAP